MQPLSPLPEALRRAESFERKRERERERERPPEAAFQAATGSEVGGMRGGGRPRKRYVGFWYKTHVPNAIFAGFFVFWAGFCGKSSQGA